MTTITLIVPVFNEETALEPFFGALEPILADAGTRFGVDFELLCVDDGSTDGTLPWLRARLAADPRLRLVALSRNFGKEAALTAGLDHATGDAVIPIDVDLQDPPALIPEMLEQWRNGAEVVLAVRSDRSGDGLLRRKTSALFYRLFNRISAIDLPADAGDFRLMDRQVVEALTTLRESNRFMKGLFAWVGFHQQRITFERPTRMSGHSKWSYWKLWNFAIDGITGFSTVLLRMWTYLGSLVALFAFVYGLIIVVKTLVRGVDVPGYASLMVVILFLGGVQLVGLGILGEYIGRIHQEVKRRPTYLIREKSGFPG